MRSALAKPMGGLALVLGVIGLSAAALGVVGVWIGEARLQQQKALIHGRADAAMVLVNDRLEQTRASLRDTLRSTDKLKTIAAAAARKALESTDTEAMDRLEQQSREGIQRAENLLALSLTAAELMEELLATVEGDDSPERVATALAALRSAQARLTTAANQLAEVRQRLTDLQERRNLATIARLALAVVAELDAVQQGLDAFQNRLDGSRARLDAYKDTVSSWITWAAVLATLLLAWIGAGQASLAMQGWRLLRAQKSAPDDPRATHP